MKRLSHIDMLNDWLLADKLGGSAQRSLVGANRIANAASIPSRATNEGIAPRREASSELGIGEIKFSC
jgi:hypothetical protein